MSFKSITIPTSPSYVVRQARVPACLVDAPPADAQSDGDGALLLDLHVERGRIAAIAQASDQPAAGASVDLDGRQLWPTLVDMHTHLDKGHTVDRTPNPDGTFVGARDATIEDRTAYWRDDDVHRRMTFGLRCAEAYGVSAIRTHLDSHPGQGETTWRVLRDVREEWKGRVALQAVALMPLDYYRDGYGEQLADIVAMSGGIMGGVTRLSGGVHGGGIPDLDALLDRVFTLAAARNLDVDLHVDETGDPASDSLRNVAEATLRHGYQGRVTCGHCCSLAVQDAEVVARTIDLLVEARISIVTLPTVNMYLQDRVAGRTPRWRGITVVKELRAKGVPVAVAGDNCRDPFYAYGDHDMLDTFRQAVRIIHLDHPHGDAPALAARVPGALMKVDHGVIRSGGPARFIVLNARSLNEVICRPHADRIVVTDGRRLERAVPDYDELAFVRAAKSRTAPSAGPLAAE
jgi:cytosine/creatinine deaminase